MHEVKETNEHNMKRTKEVRPHHLLTTGIKENFTSYSNAFQRSLGYNLAIYLLYEEQPPLMHE